MLTEAHPALQAYAAFAPYYDCFTHDFQHHQWLTRLERLARQHGLVGRRVLDVACGTGKSLGPLLALGYEGEGCDVSPEMLREAARALPGVPLFRADMRALPNRRGYAWITCLDDAINHLLDDPDLDRSLTSMAALLRPGGLLTFDVNTLRTHRASFDSTFVVRHSGAVFRWRGRGREEGPGEVGTADVETLVASAGDTVVSRHRERWWSDEEIVAAARQAGLCLIRRYGQRAGAQLDDHVDERCHAKVVYFLRRRIERNRGTGGVRGVC